MQLTKPNATADGANGAEDSTTTAANAPSSCPIQTVSKTLARGSWSRGWQETFLEVFHEPAF